MKSKLALVVFVIVLIAFISCKKDNGSGGGPSSNSNLVRIQQGVDPDITNDTVYLISYDGSKKITSIVDSLFNDTLTATYDASGNLAAVNETYGTNSTYTYDGNNQLTQIDYQLAGSHEQFVFEYTNGVVSKETYNSNLGSGPVSKQSYFTFVVTDGNITSIKAYNKNDVLVSETTCTYGSQPNTFKALSLFNYGGILGADDIFRPETFFNKNNLSGFSVNGLNTSSVYTYNGQLPTKIVTTDQSISGVFTWAFSYK